VNTKINESNFLDDIIVKKEAPFLRNLFKEDPLIRLEMLDKGAFGKVYKGIYALKEEFVAIKYIDFMVRNDVKYKKAMYEAKLMDLI